MTFVQYEHHGKLVWVSGMLQGFHSEFCLCYSCDKFFPDTPENCEIAQELFEFDVKHDMVTPVWECPKFSEKGV